MWAPIVFVTGKGGTGKSTLARALAARASREGRPAALVRLPGSGDDERDPGRTGRSPRHRRSPAGFREVVLDERNDLEAFLTRILRLGFVARRLLDSRTFSAVAAAAPGLRDLVSLAAISALASSRTYARRGLVVVDAPATGHSLPLLTAPRRVLDLGSVGPVASEAREAADLVRDPSRFHPLLVTTPEELAITEALSLRAQLEKAGIAGARLVVNGVWPSHLDRDDAQRLEESQASADATIHLRRRARQEALLSRLEAQEEALARLPFCFEEPHDEGSSDLAFACRDFEDLYHAVTEARA